MTTLSDLDKRISELNELDAELKLQSEAVNMHVDPLNKAVKEFGDKMKLMIDTIQNAIEIRSSLQIFSHTLETDPEQRWHSARLSSFKSFRSFPLFPRPCVITFFFFFTGL